MDITLKLIYGTVCIVMFFASAPANAATVWQSDMIGNTPWTFYLVTEDGDPADLDLGNVTGMYFDSHFNGQIDPFSLINNPPSSLLSDEFDIASITGSNITLTIFDNIGDLPPNSFQIQELNAVDALTQPISDPTIFSVNCSTANNACVFSNPFPQDPVAGFANILSFDGISPLLTTVIPAPPAVWLFGSGLLGLIGLARRKKA